MLIFVTESAGLVLMLGLACGKLIERGFMASAAILVRNAVGIGDHFRHVGLMTLRALRGRHIGGVRFMALSAFRLFAVNRVTLRTGKSAVLARMLTQLLNLGFVTGQASIGLICRKLDVEWLMGIIVTA